MKRSKKSGSSLIETMFAVAFVFIVATYTLDTAVEATRIQNIAGAQYDMQRQGHHEMDDLIASIHDSQLVLASYTYGGTTYKSDNSTTIILQAPAYDTNGNPLGTNDIMIYFLVGTLAPFSMEEIIIPAANSARVAENKLVIINNVQTLTLTYSCDDNIIGDGITSIFTLAGVPATTPTITKNGTALASGSGFTFTVPQTVTFNSAPAAPDALDILYPTNPQTSPSQVCSVNVDLKLEQNSSAFQDAAKIQTVELSCQTNLRNH